MVWSPAFWSRFFKLEFSRQLSTLVDVFEMRIDPAFNGIEEESEAIEKEAWEVFMSSPATGDEDPAELAENARMLGVDHYLLFQGIRVGMVNLCAAALYHAFEQQLWLFYRKEVLDIRKTPPKAFKLTLFQEKALASGIDIGTFNSWSSITELNLLANTIKHGEGASSTNLYSIRPDFFIHPSLRENGYDAQGPHYLLQPLFGDSLYVSFKDIRTYLGALLLFWEELVQAMERI